MSGDKHNYGGCPDPMCELCQAYNDGYAAGIKGLLGDNMVCELCQFPPELAELIRQRR